LSENRGVEIVIKPKMNKDKRLGLLLHYLVAFSRKIKVSMCATAENNFSR
jgi:hypothetical protein